MSIESPPPLVEEDARVVDRGEVGEAVGQLASAGVVERAEGAVGGELAHLRGGGVGELLAAVADVDVPQARGAVEVAAAVLVGHMDAVAADERELGRADRVHVGERMPEAGVGRGHTATLPNAPGPECHKLDGAAQPERWNR